MPQLIWPPTQPVRPGRTSRASSFGFVDAGLRCAAGAGGTERESSRASGTSAADCGESGRAGAISAPRPCSHDGAGCARPAAAEGAAAPVAVTAAATTCLQLIPTGHVHSPNANASSAPPRDGLKYTLVS